MLIGSKVRGVEESGAVLVQSDRVGWRAPVVWRAKRHVRRYSQTCWVQFLVAIVFRFKCQGRLYIIPQSGRIPM
jgi:hypothetical protein